MGNLAGFNAHEVEPQEEFKPLPNGKYLAVIEESEMKTNNAGTGRYLALTLQVIEGEHKGRKLWSNLNLQHPNQTAVRIAQGELSAICRAVGVMQPQDSSDLHDKPLVIKVVVEKRKDNGELTNRIKAYMADPGTSHHASPPAATPQTQGSKPASAPWRKSA